MCEESRLLFKECADRAVLPRNFCGRHYPSSAADFGGEKKVKLRTESTRPTQSAWVAIFGISALSYAVRLACVSEGMTPVPRGGSGKVDVEDGEASYGSAASISVPENTRVGGDACTRRHVRALWFPTKVSGWRMVTATRGWRVLTGACTLRCVVAGGFRSGLNDRDRLTGESFRSTVGLRSRCLKPRLDITDGTTKFYATSMIQISYAGLECGNYASLGASESIGEGDIECAALASAWGLGRW